MKMKRLVFVSCLAAVGLVASPILGAPQKRSVATSQARPQRMAPRTTQVMPAHSRSANSSNMGTARHVGTRQFARTGQYSTTRNYAGRSYAGTRYYGNGGYYYGGPSYYGSGFGYPYYNSYSYWPGASYSYYPYSYYGGYANTYSYYQPAYGYDSATVAAVQRRLAELGFYHGVVDGVMGPRTRAAITAFEDTHGMGVDGTITAALLDRMGLA